MKKLIAFVLGILFAGNLYAANLPSGYTELEYIESTGEQWIDTGVKLGYNFTVSVSAKTPNSTTAVQLFGNNVKPAQGFTCNVGNSASNVSRFGNVKYTGSLYKNSTDIHTYTVNKDGIKIDNDAIINYDGTPSDFTQTDSFYVLGARISSDINAANVMPSGTRIYSVKVLENNNVVAHFIPAKRGNEIGMYDLMDNNPANAFHTNRGSGSFTGGRELDPCRNLFDYNARTDGFYLNSDGTLSPQSGDAVSDFIPVEPNTTYYLSATGSRRGKFFDSNKQPIDPSSFDFTTANEPTSFTTGSTTRYVRFGMSGTTYDRTQIQLELGSTATRYTPYDASCHTTTTTCANLFDGGIYARGQWTNTGEWLTSDADRRIVGSLTPITPNTKYTMKINDTSDNLTFINYAYFDANKTWLGNRTTNGEQTFAGATEKTFSITDTNARYFAPIFQGIDDENISNKTLANSKVQIEEGETATEYCAKPVIKIATTKYNNTAFGPVVTALSNAVDTIKTVVANTINQATAVANLQSGKQTMPNSTATNGTCPNYRQCLLVEDESGDPHWFEIMDPFYNLFSAVIPNNVNSETPSVTGEYTRIEYIEAQDNIGIDTEINGLNEGSWEIDVQWMRTQAPTVNWGLVVGATSGDAYNSYRIISNAKNNDSYAVNGYSRAGNNGAAFVAGINYGVVHNATIYKGGVIIDGVDHKTTIQGEPILATANLRALSYGIRIYSFSAKKDNVLQGNFVPVRRNNDGMLGFYNTVNGEFKFNADGDYVGGNSTGVIGATTWAMTFGANSPLDARYNVNGSAICNATLGTANTAATSTQMSANNWTATGSNCWCSIDMVTELNHDNSSTGKNIWVWLEVPSGETCVADCASNCVAAMASGAAGDKPFRQAMTGM